MKKVFAAAAAFIAALALSASAQETQEREVLPSDVKPIRYDLTVTPNAGAMTFAGNVRIEVEVMQPTREIVLNTLDLDIDSAELESGARPTVTFNEEDQTARFVFAEPISVGRHTLTIAYRGRIYRQAQGLFSVEYPTDAGADEWFLATQFEASDARRFLPCFDEPALKAIFDLTVIVPENRMAVSNMPELSSESVGDGTKRVRFASSPLMSSYLLFLAVGDLERISTRVGDVEIGVIAKRGYAEQGRWALESAAQLIPYYNDYFGTPYPLPKLDMIAMPGGGGFSAMENWGAILYFEEYLLINPELTSEADRQNVFIVVAHEVAHQWFGNLVTMAWWDDLWLNEGFASWMEKKAAEHFHPEWRSWVQSQGEGEDAMALDARATTHSVVQPVYTAAQAFQAFDRITYEKGRAIIRMLEQHVGEDAFRAGVRDYMQRHAYGNARTADLWDAIERASAQPMRQIADDFTFLPGVPLIRVEPGSCVRGQRNITLRRDRFAFDAASRELQQPWHVPVAAALVNGNAAAGGVTNDAGVAEFTLAECGPFVVNPSQVGYYRTLYPQNNFDQLAQRFGRLDAADQLGLLYDARALGETGLSPYPAFFELARRTPRDADPLVWDVIALQLTEVDWLFSDLPEQAAYRRFARGLLAPVLTRIGWEKRPGESDNAGLVRTRLITALSTLQDPAVEAEARRRFLANDIPGDINEVVLNAVGRGADAATFEVLLARARASTDALEKVYFYEALARARDPALAQRAMELGLTDNVTAAIGVDLITTVAIDHPDLAWDFSAAHPNELSERLDSLTRIQFMPTLARRGYTEDMLRDLRTYIDTSVPADVRQGPESWYVRLQDRIMVRRERLPELNTWIAGRSRGAS